MIYKQNFRHPQDTIILANYESLISRSLATFPFITLFGKQIGKEAKKLKDFLKKSEEPTTEPEIKTIKELRTESDDRILSKLEQGFFNANNPPPAQQAPMGKNALEISLSSSLSATEIFYDTLWDWMKTTYQPSIDDVAQKMALGEKSTPSPLNLHIL